MLKFSIIVPAFNEEKLLFQGLESLVNLDYGKKDYEVILVNNNSTDKTRDIALSFPFVKVLDEPKQGHVFALICGTKQACGEILVFTDADTVVPRDWLKNYEGAYEDPGVVCAGGGAIMFPRSLKVRAAEKTVNLIASKIKYFPGFNLSIRRKVYEKIGGFDPKVNFDQDFFLVLRAKKLGRSVLVKNNEVKTSSRRYKDYRAAVYIAKSLVNITSLFVFKKSIFFEFGNIR